MDTPETFEKAPEDILDYDAPYVENDLTSTIRTIETDYDKEIQKVAILVSRFIKSEGAARVVEQHASELNKNFDIDVITFEYDGFSNRTNVVEIQDMAPIGKILKSINIPNIVYRGTFLFNLVDNIALSISLKKYDIILLHQPNLGCYNLLPGNLFNHDTIYFNHHVRSSSGRLLDDIWERMTGRIKNKIIQKPDWHVSVSKSSRQDFKKAYGVESYVVYNQLTPERFCESSDVSDSVSNGPTALFVGRMTPHKGVTDLIEICDQVNENLEAEFQLVIVGQSTSDKYESEVVKSIKNAGLEVTLMGTCSDRELAGLYQISDVYLSCSKKEGFNLPVLEAQLFGTPVVVYDIGPHSELVESGNIIELGDTDAFTRKIINCIDNGN